jgi:hypothetical protein
LQKNPNDIFETEKEAFEFGVKVGKELINKKIQDLEKI